ncbi:MAG: hypothetical protein QXZ20_03480 [Candidatus Aenigmatarchaeota archaeon]
MIRKSQSIVEYVLVVGVIIGALVAAKQMLHSKITNMIQGSGKVIDRSMEIFVEKACGGSGYEETNVGP